MTTMTTVTRPRVPVYWPGDVQKLFRITQATRWRWEKLGWLPPRDYLLGTKTGWRRETIRALGQATLTQLEMPLEEPAPAKAPAPLAGTVFEIRRRRATA